MRALTLSSKRGVTLVEVLVALAVLGLILLPVMVGFLQALIATSQSTISAAATSIAREKMEQLKATEFDLLADQPRETRQLKPGDSFFQVSVAVEIVRADDAARSGLKKAVVDVYRTGSASPVVTLTSYFTPTGI